MAIDPETLGPLLDSLATLANFFLIGPPKCATTSIANALNQHSQIFMCTPKEPNYFLYSEGNPYQLVTRDHPLTEPDYNRMFRDAGAVGIRGDASTSYIYGEHCAASIHKYNSESKIAAVLRNPVERAYSMYLYWYQFSPDVKKVSPGDFRLKFLSDALSSEAAAGGAANGKAIYWLKDMGFYHRMLSR